MIACVCGGPASCPVVVAAPNVWAAERDAARRADARRQQTLERAFAVPARQAHGDLARMPGVVDQHDSCVTVACVRRPRAQRRARAGDIQQVRSGRRGLREQQHPVVIRIHVRAPDIADVAETKQPIERGIERLDVHAVDADARHPEQRVDKPQRRGECIADPRCAAAGDAVHLVDADRVAVGVRGAGDWDHAVGEAGGRGGRQQLRDRRRMDWICGRAPQQRVAVNGDGLDAALRPGERADLVQPAGRSDRGPG